MQRRYHQEVSPLFPSKIPAITTSLEAQPHLKLLKQDIAIEEREASKFIQI